MRHRIRLGLPSPRTSASRVPVQRDGPLTLNTPGLGQSDPAAKYRLGGNLKLELDPALQARLWQQIDQELDPTKVRPALGKMSYMGPGFPKLPTPVAAAAASSAGSAPATNPFTLPAIPEPAPLVPKGEGPDKPRAGEPGDIAEAIAAVPAVDQALTGLKDQAKTKVLTDWSRLSGGEKAITVSAIALVGAGTIAGIASDPDARRLALNQLNGKVLPVPKVPWMRVEVNTGPDNLMVGIHVDVGTLLPSSLGFGPGSPEAMGGPPTQRQAVEGVGSAPGDTGARGVADEPRSTAERIRAAAAGSGAPLPPELRRSFGQELGADLSGVRLHTGAEADRLACLLDARAFTTGSDIFFREGALDPGSAAGQRLLAHEAVHTVQQATGRVEGTPVVGAGVLLSDPGDRFEREAVRKAAMLTRRS